MRRKNLDKISGRVAAALGLAALIAQSSAAQPSLTLENSAQGIKLSADGLNPGMMYGVISAPSLDQLVNNHPFPFETTVIYDNGITFKPVAHFSVDSPCTVLTNFVAADIKHETSLDGSGQQRFMRLLEMDSFNPGPTVLEPQTSGNYGNELPIAIKEAQSPNTNSITIQTWPFDYSTTAYVVFLSRAKTGFSVDGNPDNKYYPEGYSEVSVNVNPDISAAHCFPVELLSGITEFSLTANKPEFQFADVKLDVFDLKNGHLLESIPWNMSGGTTTITYDKTSNSVPVNLRGKTLEFRLTVSTESETNVFTTTKSFIPDPQRGYPFFGGQSIVFSHEWQTNSYYWTEMVKPMLDGVCDMMQFTAENQLWGTPITQVPWNYLNNAGSFLITTNQQSQKIAQVRNQLEYPHPSGYGTLAHMIYVGNATTNVLVTDSQGIINDGINPQQLGNAHQNTITESDMKLHDGKMHRVIQYKLLGMMPSSQFYASSIGGQEKWSDSAGLPMLDYSDVGHSAWPPKAFSLGLQNYLDFDAEYSMYFAYEFNYLYMIEGFPAAAAYGIAYSDVMPYDPIPPLGNPNTYWSESYLTIPGALLAGMSASDASTNSSTIASNSLQMNLMASMPADNRTIELASILMTKYSGLPIYEFAAEDRPKVSGIPQAFDYSQDITDYRIGPYKVKNLRTTDESLDHAVAITYVPATTNIAAARAASMDADDLNARMRDEGFLPGDISTVTNTLNNLPTPNNNYTKRIMVLSSPGTDFPVAMMQCVSSNSTKGNWSSIGPTYKAVGVGVDVDGSVMQKVILLEAYGLAGSIDEIRGIRTLNESRQPIPFFVLNKIK